MLWNKGAGLVVFVLLLLLSATTACVPKKVPERLPGDIITVTRDTYKAEVLNYKGPCLVLFFDDAGPSSQMHRRFIYFADRFGKHVKFVRFKWAPGADPAHYKLEATPTVVLYQSGAEIDRVKGNPPTTSEYQNWDDDFELWILRMALRVKTDELSSTYECYFRNGYDLKFSNY